MKKIILFAASNSPQSINRKLIDYASTLFPNHSVTVVDLREFPLPIYSTEIEQQQGIPEKALALKNIIDEADAYVVSVAEHNHSVTAFAKNIFDWLSRTQKDYKILKGKPVLLLSASPSPGGGRNAATHAEAIFKEIGGNVIAKFPVASFYSNVSFDDAGFHFKDDFMTTQLTEMTARLTV